MFTIEPRPRAFIVGSACLAQSQAPLRSTAKTASHSASVMVVASK